MSKSSTSKPSEQAESAVENYLRSVLERQPVCVARVARDGTLLAVNDAALTLLEAQSVQEVLGKRLPAMVADDQDGCAQFIQATVTGERASLEVELVGLRGNRSTLKLSAVPGPDSPDGLESALVTFRDLSEQRRLEQSLVEAAGRIEDLETALQDSERRVRETEAVATQGEYETIDLDADTSSSDKGR